MNISINDLEIIAHKLFRHASNLGIASVDIPVDYYWNIPETRLYDINASTTELADVLGMGQLTYDWDELVSVLSNENEPTSSHYAWFAAILRAVGENLYNVIPEST